MSKTQETNHGPGAVRVEIEIVGLIRALWKHKLLIVGGTLLATFIAAVVSFALPNVYEVSTIIEPGKAKESKPGEIAYIVSPEALRESILGEAFDYKIKKELGLQGKDYPKINVYIPKNTSLLKIYAESSDPSIPASVIDAMIKLIDEEINTRIEYDKKDIDNQIKTTKFRNDKIEELVVLTKKQVEETKKKIKALEISKAKALAESADRTMHVLLYSNEIQNQQIYINSLEEKLKNYEEEAKGASVKIDNLQLQLSRIKGMNVFKPVTISDRPVKPKKIKIVALTFAASLLLMTLITLVLSIIKNSDIRRDTD